MHSHMPKNLVFIVITFWQSYEEISNVIIGFFFYIYI